MSRTRTDTKYIVVHGSWTPPSMDLSPETVDKWHKDKGWSGNGYHLHIDRDGTPRLTSRLWHVQGAGVLGHNHHSFHIMLVGGKPADPAAAARQEWDVNYTEGQMYTLRWVLPSLLLKYPNAKVVGHNDLDNRGCPGFDVKEWWANVE
jgi:N-acetylmuramoyl-L-alanine amidase